MCATAITTITGKEVKKLIIEGKKLQEKLGKTENECGYS